PEREPGASSALLLLGQDGRPLALRLIEPLGRADVEELARTAQRMERKAFGSEPREDFGRQARRLAARNRLEHRRLAEIDAARHPAFPLLLLLAKRRDKAIPRGLDRAAGPGVGHAIRGEGGDRAAFLVVLEKSHEIDFGQGVA